MTIDFTTLLDKLNPDPGGESTVRIRVGTVSAVNADGTLDILMSSGAIVPNVNKLASAVAPLGANVQMIAQRGSFLVIGAVSGAVTNPAEVAGSVTLTPVTANVVVSTTVTFPALGGTGTVIGFATANTGVPGSAGGGVSEVSVSGLSTTSATINLSRNGLTATTVYYLIRRATP